MDWLITRHRFPRCLAALVAVVVLSAGLSLVAVGSAVRPAVADTQPVDPTLPETVSAAALPTVQISGVVWAQVIVGNRVFATGQFSQARPAGSPEGVNTVPRSNILAYDLTTGVLIDSWAPSLNAQGMALAASADGSTIFVGGDFDHVNGQVRSRVAALNAQTGALLPFNPGANSRVQALAVTNTTLYFGGDFTTVGTTQSGFSARSRLAAADVATGAILPWAPTADNLVRSMVYHQPSGRLIVGGSFDFLNGSTQLGMGSLDGVTGAVEPWAINTLIQNHGSAAAISSLTTDGEQVFGVGWAFFGGGATANFEGVFAADPWTGAMNWVDGGRGDNYGIAVAGDVLYTVGHPHDWGMLSWNPQYLPTYQHQRTLAIDKDRSPTLTNAYGSPDIWKPFQGQPAAQPLHWLPTLTGGTYTGQGQAAWSVASNGDYVVEGGEFPLVNGIAQQGLVRFAKRTISPLVDTVQGYVDLAPTLTPMGPGTVRVGWEAAWDRDNELLKVEVLRGDTTATSTVLQTTYTHTTWWNRPPLGFVDRSAPPGSTQTYRIRVTDPFGNGFAGPPATVTIPAGTPPPSQYASSVGVDVPDWQWRMGEASGTTAYDRAGSNDLTLNSANTRNIAGALLNETDTATNFPGTTSTSTVQGAAPYWQQGPQTFSLEAWVRTSTNQGGQIMGFGDSNTGRSSSDGVDRNLYMNNNGQIYFGVRPDMGVRTTINSPATYRDNAWHQVVGTLGADGMKLYVDGNLVAQNVNIKKAQVYRGYWRVGGDRLLSWPSQPNREAISANIDEVAVYPKALTVGHIRAHYLASGRTTVFPNILPVGSFSSSTHYLTGLFDGTGSSDDDGTIASYAWNFGDNTTGTGATPQHTYASPGTYTVGLTVTDNRGGIAAPVTGSVTVVSPPANIPPVPSFTSGVTYRTATLTSTSTDEDGTIASAAWNFGDGTTGTGLSVQKTYAAAGTYPITLSVTDNRGDTEVATGSVTVSDLYASDTFTRTVVNGLGIAENGGPWTISGSAASFADNNGAARITGAVAANRAAYMTSVHQTDLDIRSTLSLNVASTGGGVYTSLIGRRVSAGNDYRVKLRYQQNGTVIAYVERNVGNVETVLANVTVPGLVVNPGDVLRTRLLVTGTSPATVRVKIWRKGTMEPQAWLLTATDTTPVLQAPGDAGVLVYISSSWTGALPVISLDDVKIGPDGGPPVNMPPIASFTNNAVYHKVWFDGGASSDSDEDGGVVGYSWNFGDGATATGATPQHTYAAAGNYNITLTVADNGGVTGSLTQQIQVQDAPPPTAFFDTSYTFLSADFNAAGSGDIDGTIVAYNWNFGDGTTGTGVTPHHDYSAAGTYTVTLNVVDNDGNIGTGSAVLVLDPVPPPSAAFTSSTFFRTASLDATGSSAVTGSIVSYAWDFGDGTSDSGLMVQHTYATAGTYNVTLTVTDSLGGTDSHSSDVTVESSTPPTAAFTATPTYLAVGFDGTGSSAAVGSLVSYAWDFGDGAVGTGSTAQHTYSAAGTYHVALTVTDSFGGTNTLTSDVTVDAGPAPTAAFSATPTYLAVGLDGTGSSATVGTLVSYAWDFGDTGTGTGSTAQHTYSAAGTYPVTLTVTDSFGGTNTLTSDVTVAASPAPTAAFSATPTYLGVAFDGTGSSAAVGSLVSYAWDFGDTGTGTGSMVQHTYSAAGTYHVALTVTDSFGGTNTLTSDVTVADAPPPTAAFTATPTFLSVQFDGTSSSDVDGTIASYAWNFGDTATGTGPTPTHPYATAGTYNVTLTVTDNTGHTGSTTVPVTVIAPPVKYATDTFTRTVVNGLGTADVGGAYTLSGTASNFSVGSGRGRIADTAGGTRAAYLNGVSRTEIDYSTDVSLDLASTGGGAYVSLIGRGVVTGTDYRVKLRYQSNGTVVVYLVHNIANVETVLGSITVPSLTMSPGDTLRVRFMLSGTTTTTIRAKVWRQGAVEPTNWLVSATESTPAVLQAPGDVGIMLYVSGSWIGTTPALSFDNLDISPPAP